LSAKTPAKGHASKHVHKASKHHKAKGKHHLAHHAKPVGGGAHPVHAVAAPAHHPKPRGFAVGDLLPVCALEAVAMSLRLAGQRVSDGDVAGLWELYGELSIPEAAALLGLVQQRDVGPVKVEALRGKLGIARGKLGIGSIEGLVEAGPQVHGLILGINVPGPHAVLATADGWWSWGELHDPWPATIEEAWAVSWS